MNMSSIVHPCRKLRSFYDLSLEEQQRMVEFAEKLLAEVLRERMTARPETAPGIVSMN